ncbi:ABC transporter permease [Leucobacter tenebrionis]|uniref:ABC transporter permease n=1 Tax=Leucobacter tenebrionis TaxID=2873270 RepID=UPI001CA72F77|nr:ABC transporter permease [Leucobacter tenebrionis]QZY51614.1 ABC transporter permease [Leucobacter tenebrionis]
MTQTDTMVLAVRASGGKPRANGRNLATLGLLLPSLLLLASMFAYPLGTGIMQSFSDPTWGLDNYIWFFSSQANRDMLWRTLAVAGATTLFTLVIGYPYAYLMTLVGPTLRTVLLALVMLPFWVSALVRTFAWFVILQDAGALNQLLAMLGLEPLHLIRTPMGVMIGMTQVLLPFMVLPLYNVLRGIDRRLLTAAESMGARPASAFMRVFVPLSVPGIMSGAVIVFVTALGFYIFPALLGSPSEAMLSQAIFNETSRDLNFGHAGAIGVVLLLVLVAIALIGLLGMYLLRLRSRRLGKAEQ